MDLILAYLKSNIPQLVTAGVSIGFVWKILQRVLAVLKEIQELLNAIVVAMSDGKLTKKEVDIIIKEAKDIPVVIKALLKK